MFSNITKNSVPVQLTLPLGGVVKKSNKIVQTRIYIENDDVYSSRILAGLISTIRMDDVEFKDVYRIAVKELIQTDSNADYGRIKSSCESLIKARVFVDEYDIDTGERKYVWINFLERIEYYEGEGLIDAVFTRSMGPYLLNLKQGFTEYILLEYLRLSTVYSQRFYEFLKSWSGTKKFKIKIETFHDILNSPPSCRKNYKNLRVRIIEPSKKEIEEKTELRFSYVPVKKGTGRNSKVTDLEFSFINIRPKNKKRKKTDTSQHQIYISDNRIIPEWIQIQEIIKTKVTAGEFDLWFNKLIAVQTDKGICISWNDTEGEHGDLDSSKRSSLTWVKSRYGEIIKDSFLKVGIKSFFYDCGI